MRGRLGGSERFTIPVQSSDGALGEVFGGVGHGLNMTQTIFTVYSNLLYSVDLRENPMFAGVKQGSRTSFGTGFRLDYCQSARCPGAR